MGCGFGVGAVVAVRNHQQLGSKLPLYFTHGVGAEVAVTVHDGSFHCDFTGTADQVRGPFNCVPSGSLAAACFAIRAITDPAIPTNAGCFRPITLNLPKGSIVNPVEPAAVNARTATIKRITSTILGALRPVISDRVSADASGEMAAIMFGGKRADGTTFVTGEMIAGFCEGKNDSRKIGREHIHDRRKTH